jgi:hypothetical protein
MKGNPLRALAHIDSFSCHVCLCRHPGSVSFGEVGFVDPIGFVGTVERHSSTGLDGRTGDDEGAPHSLEPRGRACTARPMLLLS